MSPKRSHDPAHEKFVAAVARRQRRHVNAVRQTRRGEVTSLDPLTVKLFGDGEEISEDDEGVDLSQWVIFYDREWGIDKGDTAVMHCEDGEWTITDVVGTKELHMLHPGGDAPNDDPTVSD